MSKLPTIRGRELVKFLEAMGFKVARTRGSHVEAEIRRWKSNHRPCAWEQGTTQGTLAQDHQRRSGDEPGGVLRLIFEIKEM